MPIELGRIGRSFFCSTLLATVASSGLFVACVEAQVREVPLETSPQALSQTTYSPPVHVTPFRQGRQAARSENQANDRSILAVESAANGNQAIHSSGANRRLQESVIRTQFSDPLPATNTGQQDVSPIRVSQTPASPASRPKDPSPTPPQQLESILPAPDLFQELTNDIERQRDAFSANNQENDLRSQGPVARPISSPLRSTPSHKEFSQAESVENGPARDGKKFKDCDDFRAELLGKRLVDISLDVSPPPNVKMPMNHGSVREWRDQNGVLLASGSLVDIRRGYVIIDSQGQLLKIAAARLSESDLSVIADLWQIPTECLVSTGVFGSRCWVPQTVTWYASNLCHKPLYFEQVQLERYGHSAGPVLGPLRATAHFFGSAMFLPYHTAIHPPNECVYALGYYRPGNCAPWLVEPFPISLKGAVRQGAVVVGGFYLF